VSQEISSFDTTHWVISSSRLECLCERREGKEKQGWAVSRISIAVADDVSWLDLDCLERRLEYDRPEDFDGTLNLVGIFMDIRSRPLFGSLSGR
jgi:hypothetical protein